jgi:hypothetical protein
MLLRSRPISPDQQQEENQAPKTVECPVCYGHLPLVPPPLRSFQTERQPTQRRKISLSIRLTVLARFQMARKPQQGCRRSRVGLNAMLISLPVVTRGRGSEAFSRAILSSLTSDGINPLCLQTHQRVGTLSSRVLLSCSRCTDLASLKRAYRADFVPLPSIGRRRASTMLSRRRRAPISLDIIIFHNGTRTCLTSTPITRTSDKYIPRLA